MRRLLILTALLSAWLRASAQEPPTDSLTAQQRHEQVYSTLNPAYLTTGVLLDRTVPFSAVRRLDGTRDTVASYGNWQQMYLEFWNASLQREALLLPTAVYRRVYQPPALPGLPLQVLHYQYDRLRPDAEALGLIHTDTVAHRIYDVAGRTQSPYEVKRALALSLPEKRVYRDTIPFYLGRDQFFGNVVPDSASLSVDFGDGQGLRSVSLGQTYSIAYPTRGAKLIRLTWTQSGHSWQASTSLRVSSIPPPDRAVPVVATNAWPGQTEYGRARAYVAAGVGNPKVPVQVNGQTVMVQKIRKPLIFVEGIDFGSLGSDPRDSCAYAFVAGLPVRIPFRYGTAGWPLMQEYDEEYPSLEKLPALRARLQAAGYDVIFFDFNDGEALIQQNAMALVQFIRWLNDPVNHTDPTQDVDVVVMGASMGGQVARFALTWLEQQGEKHCGNLYVSFDSPHFGANVPLGLQFLIDDLSTLYMLPDSPAQLNRDKLNSRASQQMLRQHYNQAAWPRQFAWYDWIQDPASWPTHLRKIAIANGSRNAADQGYGSGELMLATTGAGDIAIGNKHCFALAGATVWWNFGFSHRNNVVYWDRQGFPAAPITRRVDPTTPLWDSAPGCVYQVARSLYEAAQQGPIKLFDENTVRNNCFMPTVSTLGVKVGAPNHPGGPDLYYHVYSHIANTDLPNPGEYFFDAYFAPDGNEPHVQITDGTPSTHGNATYGTPAHNNTDWLLRELSELSANVPAVLQANVTNLTAVYNYGNPFHKTLRSTTVNAGGQLFVNNGNLPTNSGPIGSNPAPQQGTFRLDTRECGAVVKVNTGGFFELGTAGATPTGGYKAEVHFNSGSVLTVNDGGTTLLNSYSSLIVEGGAQARIEYHATPAPSGVIELKENAEILVKAGGWLVIDGTLRLHNHARIVIEPGATLEIWPRAHIELNGDNARLDLKGLLDIQAGGTFTFTGAGYVNFDLPTDPSGRFRVAPGGAFHLVGSGPADVVATIPAGRLLQSSYWGDFPFIIEQGRVEMGAGARIDCGNASVKLAHAAFVSLPNQRYGEVAHRGCGREEIHDCLFRGAVTGLLGDLNGCNGSGGWYERLTFEDCETGLQTIGKGATLTDCQFLGTYDPVEQKGPTGWLMAGASFDQSHAAGCSFEGHKVGIAFNGSVGSNLDLRQTQLHHGWRGVQFMGGGQLFGKCAGLWALSQDAISVTNGSLVLVNSHLLGNGGLSRYQVSVARNIRLNDATGLNLQGGGNDIVGLTGHAGIFGFLKTDQLITGELYSIDAWGNRWNLDHLAPSYPPYTPVPLQTGTDIQLNTLDMDVIVFTTTPSTFSWVPLELLDDQPMTDVAAIQAAENCGLDPCLVPVRDRYIRCDEERPFAACASCEKVTTSFVTNDSLHHAVLVALSYQHKYDSTSTDANALAKLRELLLLPLTDTTREEARVLRSAYDAMRKLFAASLADSAAPPQLLYDVINQQLAATVPDSLLHPEFYPLMDLALTAYSAGDLATARAALVPAGAATNPLNHDYYAYWDCFLGLTQQYQDSALTLSEYAAQVGACSQATQLASRGTQAESPREFLARVQARNEARAARRARAAGLTLHPNPAQRTVTLTLPAEAGELTRVEAHDLTGRLLRVWERAAEGAAPTWTLDLGSLPAGTCVLTATTPSRAFRQRLVVRP